jgi:hypothetical protein
MMIFAHVSDLREDPHRTGAGPALPPATTTSLLMCESSIPGAEPGPLTEDSLSELDDNRWSTTHYRAVN